MMGQEFVQLSGRWTGCLCWFIYFSRATGQQLSQLASFYVFYAAAPYLC